MRTLLAFTRPYSPLKIKSHAPLQKIKIISKHIAEQKILLGNSFPLSVFRFPLFEESLNSCPKQCKIILYGVLRIVVAEGGGYLFDRFPIVGVASEQT